MRYDSFFHINLEALAGNYKLVQERSPGLQVLWMVKANAYGHGIEAVSRFAVQEMKCAQLGVATLAEAMILRQELKFDPFEIYVFSDLNFYQAEYHKFYSQARLLPVIGTESELDIFLTVKDFQNTPLVLKFNTGMNRLGLDWERAHEIGEKIKGKGRKSIFHLMTHLASSNLPLAEGSVSTLQMERFHKVHSQLLSLGLSIERQSLSNSAAIEQNFQIPTKLTHVRPGIMMYGPSGMMPQKSKQPWAGKIPSTLATQVLHTYQAKKGTPIGYGGAVLPQDGKMVVLALGYGDGISNCYQKARLQHGDDEGIVIGRINMDMTTVLFSEQTKIKAGDRFYFWKEDQQRLSSLCSDTGTIAYELFCQLSLRVPRIYSNQTPK